MINDLASTELGTPGIFQKNSGPALASSPCSPSSPKSSTCGGAERPSSRFVEGVFHRPERCARARALC
jgi:hypothetical protein